ncbi:MAG: hypothetical protein Ct9H300mP32_2410 [Verrucomicrobiota bacterium]|nr:MAG: hypothetical protein Ct9H300mP32_2410 [Verrucomicrobiota bacterium]
MMPALPFKAIGCHVTEPGNRQANTIPWHLPKDFEWFKQTTMGHVLVIGGQDVRVNRPPPAGPEMIVLTPQCRTDPRRAHDGDLDALDREERFWRPDNFHCGGAEVYAQAFGPMFRPVPHVGEARGRGRRFFPGVRADV